MRHPVQDELKTRITYYNDVLKFFIFRLFKIISKRSKKLRTTAARDPLFYSAKKNKEASSFSHVYKKLFYYIEHYFEITFP